MSTVLYVGDSVISPVCLFLYTVLLVVGSMCIVSCRIVTLVSALLFLSFVALIRPNLSDILICAVTIASALTGSLSSLFFLDAIRCLNSRRNSFLSSTAFFLANRSCLRASCLNTFIWQSLFFLNVIVVVYSCLILV